MPSLFFSIGYLLKTPALTSEQRKTMNWFWQRGYSYGLGVRTMAEPTLGGSNGPKGEFVLVVEGAKEGSNTSEAFWTDMTVPEHVAHYVEQGMTKKDAIKAAAKDRGVPKNEVYQQVLD